LDALGGTVTRPAWRTRPSFYLVATDDRMIPPPAQRTMAERAGATVSETDASHAVYVSKPAEVAALIKKAASGATA
jgi:pimeloyl-ACP methyl ester carboxylesterase